MANEKANRHYGKREILIALVGMAVILAVIIYNQGGTFLQDPREFAGGAPEIEFEMPNGKTTSIHKLKGNTILLNFWAAWCAPCMEEMPSLKMLEEHLKDRGFILLAFNISESKDQLRGKFGGTDMPENLIFNFNKEFLRPYDVSAIPVSVLIDSTGQVKKVYSGPRNWLDMSIRREIEKLLK